MKTPYDVLGVRRFADANAIRAALRRIAKTHHPDINPHDPEGERRLKEALMRGTTIVITGAFGALGRAAVIEARARGATVASLDIEVPDEAGADPLAIAVNLPV